MIDPCAVVEQLWAYKNKTRFHPFGLLMRPDEIANYEGTVDDIFDKAMTEKDWKRSATVFRRMFLVKFVVAFEVEFG